MLPLYRFVFCRSVWVGYKEKKAKGKPMAAMLVLSSGIAL